jgi:predicted lipoprotein with Yx(FWY)xxD motif
MLKKVVAAAVAAAALAVAGVAAAAAVTHPQSFRSLAASNSGKLVMLHQTSVGKVLATSTGLTLYLFKADKGKTSVCYGQCATFWPPLLVKGKLSGGPGIKAKLIGETMRKNGTHQVTYAGHPLYRFKLDKKASQVKGQGQDFFGGKWFVVSSSGKAITKAAPTGTTTGTTTTGSTGTTTTRY